jgi:hypothetical protein
MKRMVELGRQSKIDSSVKALIESLCSGSLYEQFLGLETCYGSRDVGLAMRTLSSPSKYLKKRSLALVALFGNDAELLGALNSVPAYLQVYSIRRLRTLRGRRRRPKVIDQFLEELERKPENSKLFQGLLPFGSETIVRRNLSKVLDRFGTIDWARLAQYHPEVIHAELCGWAMRSKEEDLRLRAIANQTLRLLGAVESRADMALNLLKTMMKSTSLSHLAVQDVLERRPEQTLELILASKDAVSLNFSWILPKISKNQLFALLDRYQLGFQHIFARFKPAQRRAIYGRVKEEWRNSDGVFPIYILPFLPSDLRIQESRRHITLKVFEAKPSDRIPYIGLLPWTEALELLTPYLRSNDADIRSAALESQVQCAKYDDDHLGSAVQFVLKRQFEQNPVRDAMITALCNTSPSRWNEDHLPALAQVVRHALDAADLSAGTIRQTLSLLSGILSFHPRWAGSQIALVMQERGIYDMTRSIILPGVIPVKDTMEIVDEVMSPLVETLSKKKNTLALRQLAQNFDIYTEYWASLLNALDKTIETTEDFNDQNVVVLKRHLPHSWTRVIPRLIEAKSNLLGLQDVIKHVHHHRQTLLSIYLNESDPIPFSWFGYGFRQLSDLNALSELYGGFWRWSPTQQDEFAHILVKQINDTNVAAGRKQSSIKQLALLPFVDVKYLTEFSSDDRPNLRETALRALGRLDGDQGVPVLFNSLQDDRARIAIYALRNILRSMSKIDQLELLKSVPMEKVTVAKEAVRLVGDLDTEEALQYLLAKEKVKLHSDVRIAIFRALWSYLERDEPWEVFSRAAADPDPETAKAVSTIPDNGLSSKARRALLGLLLKLLYHPAAEVRLTALGRCDTLEDPDSTLVARLFELLSSPIRVEATQAAQAVFKTYGKAQHERIADAFRQILGNRKMLQSHVDTYLSAGITYTQKHLLPATLGIISVLKEDKLTLSLRLKLIFLALPWEQFRAHFLEIIPELQADTLVQTEVLIKNSMERGKVRRATELETELRGSGDEKARRLALAFLLATVDRMGKWTDELKQRLEEYRQDSSVLVAEAATYVFPPEDQ